MGIIIDLIVGALSGWIAAKIMNVDSSNIFLNLVLGLVGGIVFGLIANLFGIGATNIFGQIIFSVIGACLLVWLYNKYAKK